MTKISSMFLFSLLSIFNYMVSQFTRGLWSRIKPKTHIIREGRKEIRWSTGQVQSYTQQTNPGSRVTKPQVCQVYAYIKAHLQHCLASYSSKTANMYQAVKLENRWVALNKKYGRRRWTFDVEQSGWRTIINRSRISVPFSPGRC